MSGEKPMIEEVPPAPYMAYNYDDVQDEAVMDAVVAHPKGKPLTEAGGEVVDGIPLEPPLGYVRTEPLAVQIRNQVILQKALLAAEEAGDDTFEEADDFDVGDDYDPTSPYEVDFDPMSDEDKAALASQGRDIERSLSQEQKEKFARATSARSVTKEAEPPESGQPKVATPTTKTTTD